MNINQFLYVDSLIVLLESRSTKFPINIQQLITKYELEPSQLTDYEDRMLLAGKQILSFYGIEPTEHNIMQFSYLMMCPPVITREFHVEGSQFAAVYHVSESPDRILELLEPFQICFHKSLESKLIGRFTNYFHGFAVQ